MEIMNQTKITNVLVNVHGTLKITAWQVGN